MGYRDSEEYKAKEKERKRLYHERKKRERQESVAGRPKPAAQPANVGVKANPKPAKKKSTAAKPAKRKKPTPKARGNRADRSAGQLSLVEAAVKVLQQSDGPMKPVNIVERAINRGLWKKQDGKTPGATLWARILDDIKRNGRKSTFVKAGPGLFGLRK